MTDNLKYTLEFYDRLNKLKKCKIWLVEYKDKVKYNQYDSATVIAEDEDEAKTIRVGILGEEWFYPEDLSATLVGTPSEEYCEDVACGTKNLIICSSFNAG